MLDGKFFPCGRCEHRQTLTDLLFGDYSRYRLSGGSTLREPVGAVCLHDTDFKIKHPRTFGNIERLAQLEMERKIKSVNK